MQRTTRRHFLQCGLAAGAALAAPRRAVRAAGPNDEIQLGFISCGGRGRELMNIFSKMEGVRIAALCDPDRSQLDRAASSFPQADTWTDLRDLLDQPAMDAVVVATCNHWHCLAAIWAMQAGKHVYVEKPLSHNQWEGAQTVAAARKYQRICQVGTQQRSDPMQQDIQRFLHDDKMLGDLRAVRVNRFGVRGPIGKRATPLEIPATVDYNLWLGPAQERPIFRDKLQYDWHWDWNTGSGEMGNWGVHVLDDVRNNVFRDQVALPRRILGGGGRVAWNDAGETPNLHFVWFDTGTIPVIIGLANITASPDSSDSPPCPGPGSGYIVYCEGGRLEGQRGRAVAFDVQGRELHRFPSPTGDRRHQQNFIDALRAGDASLLNADVQIGHDSAGWCNLANIAFRVGGNHAAAPVNEVDPGQAEWSALLADMGATLAKYDMNMSHSSIRMSPLLELDPASGQFVGSLAEQANRLLGREYRAGFEVPRLTG